MKKVSINGPINDLSTKLSTFFNTKNILRVKLVQFYKIARRCRQHFSTNQFFISQQE